MATIKDIAKLAGVSITTVSRVLNNHPYVNDEKRRRVEEIVRKLNYRQNLNAVHLVKGKTMTVGVLLPNIDYPYFQLMVGGVMEAAFRHQYSVICCPTAYNEEEELKYLFMLQRKQIDGLIVCSHANSWETILPFQEYGPIVACEYTNALPCVYTNHYAAFLDGMRYLRDRGHQNIGYCTARAGGASSGMRLSAYRRFSEETGMSANESWIFPECFTLEDGKRVIRHLMQMDHRPSAMLVNGDEVAAGMLVQARTDGLSVPGDLSIVGAGNQPFSEALELTTIDQNIKEIGRQSFALFLAGEPKQICVRHEIVERGTVRSV
ncbi:LacI family DNA-binding transcriptional regulator [Paenibacillus caui]|uniref:LacI family DNA-binding transcriptional regulator n=1 Tax=Paenibacillus caui TaxID=2873927 RepID=UPI001CA7E00E|nr:LacI family DNA-binding transcriptional regulator [Paenibacillus caui]